MEKSSKQLHSKKPNSSRLDEGNVVWPFLAAQSFPSWSPEISICES
jgi:hypothetical protein